MERLAFTIFEAAESANISRSLIYKHIANGTGPRFRKAGNRTLILREDLIVWLRTLPDNRSGRPPEYGNPNPEIAA